MPQEGDETQPKGGTQQAEQGKFFYGDGTKSEYQGQNHAKSIDEPVKKKQTIQVRIQRPVEFFYFGLHTRSFLQKRSCVVAPVEEKEPVCRECACESGQQNAVKVCISPVRSLQGCYQG